ncbi:WXG100 family type VII secretion target [Nonomuraea ferruginea]
MGAAKPPEDWPGLVAERDGVGYDATKITNVAEALREIMKPINGGGYGEHQGSIQDLSINGSLSDVRTQLRSIDRNQGTESFATTLETAHREFLDVYEDVLENFSTAIALVEAGAKHLQSDGHRQPGGVRGMGGTKHEIHLIKPSCGSWAVETGGRSVEQVVTFIKGFNLTSITQAASSYEDAKTAVETAREAIKTQAIKLAEVWEGEASVEAQTALGILYVTMGELATKLGAMHTPVDNLASVVREHQAFMEDHSKGILNTWTNRGGTGATWDDSIPDIYSAYAGYYGGDGKVLNEAKTDFGSPDELAGLHLQTFTNDLVVVHQAIPDTVDKSLRDIKPPGMPQDDPTQVDYPTGLPTGNPSPYSNTGLGLNGGTDGTGNPGGPSFADYDPSTGLPNPNGVDPNGTNPNGYDPNGNYPPRNQRPGRHRPRRLHHRPEQRHAAVGRHGSA